jgi:hypothetical protein
MSAERETVRFMVEKIACEMISSIEFSVFYD